MAESNKGKKRTLFGALGLVGVLAVKFKFYLLAAWKALAFLKLSWFLSPLLSIGMYALLWGWTYACAIVLLLFIHEMGHWVWMKAIGLEPKAPVFVPFVGAYVAMTKLPPDQTTHAWVALAGPLIGGIGAAALYTAGIYMGNGWMIAAGSTGFFLNLMQLIPAKPLDGGFVVQAVSRWLLVPGTAMLLALAFIFHSVLFLIVGGVSAFALVKQLMHKEEAEPSVLTNRNPAAMKAFDPNYAAVMGHSATEAPTALVAQGDASMLTATTVSTEKPISSSAQLAPASPAQRVIIAVAYLGLASMLGYLYWLSSSELVSFMPQR